MGQPEIIKPMTQFAADFETTTDPDHCRVWLWQVRDIANDEIICQGTKISEYVGQAPKGRHFFHNMGFDAAFLIDYLLRHAGYTWVQLDNSPQGCAEGRHILHPKQFTSLIGDQGSHYEVSFFGEHGVVVLRDSLRKVPGSLKELGVAYGAEVKKGETPLHAQLPDDYVPTAEEWEYLDNDTLILSQVLRTVIGEGYTSMTVGGDCFRDWKTLFHNDFKLDGEKKDETFRRVFPLLSHHEDTTIRKAYRGGWTFVKRSAQGELLTCGGRVYDVNSMYPAVMVQHLFPIGQPRPLAPGERASGKYQLEIRGAIVSYKLRDEHLPCIPKNTETFGGSGWSLEADEVELWGTGQEWTLWEEQYELHIEQELGGYAFKAIHGDKMFGPYIEHFMRIKEREKGPKRLLAKLSLNNLWGKFGTDPYRAQRVPTFESGEKAIAMPADPKHFDDPVYTPVAVFTTAYARERIVRSAQANYDRFCYADTDSLHMTGDSEPVGLEIHPTRLGAWDHEGTWTEAVYCRSKAYVERMQDGHVSVAMAGLPAAARGSITPETIHDGMMFSGKLSKKRVVGGIVLAPVAWKLDYRLGICVVE